MGCILAGLCVCMFLFIWWWFPRMYKKGIRADMDRVDEDNRMRVLHENEQADIEAARRAEAGEGDPTNPPPVYSPPPKKPTTVMYTPPAYTSY
ncbi:uncharacterized protein LTR77_002916 [Saxophila tyrrhenica]|uniref:Uncharacterized protein n=1 Tax=Saxophila tyrrhenica TaxID=1690608 RepID=A0AAV9PGI9_9PEZI|nr:hypothetical protein LTR77_002916 [Saxophila tyrrhenica]